MQGDRGWHSQISSVYSADNKYILDRLSIFMFLIDLPDFATKADGIGEDWLHLSIIQFSFTNFQ